MKQTSRMLLIAAALFLLGVFFYYGRVTSKKDTIQDHLEPVPKSQSFTSPRLLPAREATPERPLQSWERLLVEGGSPAEDRASLEDVLTVFLETTSHDPRPALGTNEEITRALSDSANLGDTAIPASHPAIVDGQLVDRWGSPWFFHQQSANVIEVRSAGPDRKLFTADDVAK